MLKSFKIDVAVMSDFVYNTRGISELWCVCVCCVLCVVCNLTNVFGVSDLQFLTELWYL
jgi:hypothetical protein